MPDVKSLSNEELQRIANGEPKKAADPGQMSTMELVRLVKDSEPSEKFTSMGQKFLARIEKETPKKTDTSAFQGFVSGLEEFVPFSGLARKAGVAGALIKEEGLPGLARFKEYEQRAIDKSKKAIEEHPVASGFGKGVGFVSGFGVPIPGAGAKGLAGAATRVIGSAGTTAADVATRQAGVDTGEGLKAGLLSGGLGAAFESLGAGIRAIAPSISKSQEKVKDLAESIKEESGIRAAKAATGQQKKALMELAGGRNRKDAIKKIADFGEQLREVNPITGKRLVVAGDTVKSIAKKASAAKEASWGIVDDVYKKADELAGGATVKVDDIVESLMERATLMDAVSPEELRARDEIIKVAERMMDRFGDSISLEKAQNLKNKFIPAKGLAAQQLQILDIEAKAIVREAITDAMSDGIKRVSPEMQKQWADAMKWYGISAQASGDATERAIANISNRWISPSDYATGLGGGLLLSKAGEVGGPLVKTALAVTLGLANKLVRSRGSSTVSAGLEKLANVLENNPDALGKFADVLGQAALRGSDQFALTHGLLMLNPEYSGIMSSQEKLGIRTPQLGGR